MEDKDKSKERRPKKRLPFAVTLGLATFFVLLLYLSFNHIRTEESDATILVTHTDKKPTSFDRLRGIEDESSASKSVTDTAVKSTTSTLPIQPNSKNNAATTTVTTATVSNIAATTKPNNILPTDATLQIHDPKSTTNTDTTDHTDNHPDIAQMHLKPKETEETKETKETKAAVLPTTKTKAEMKKEFDAGYIDLAPLDFGMDENGGPDGKRDYGHHPHYMAKCHSCTHHKFTYVAIEGNHEPEIVRNLGRVMCAMKNLPPDCGQHFIEHDCTPFTGFDNRDWFTFTFAMNPHNRAVSSWTLGIEHDITKAGISHHNLDQHIQKEEKYCGFRRWVLWAMGMDRTASMSCPFNKPDLQVNAIYTKDNLPALNFVGRIEHYTRDITSILQLIDPSGNMVKYHEEHAKEFKMHPPHHPHDWKDWYRDHKIPDIWKLVTRMYKEDIEKLGYDNVAL